MLILAVTACRFVEATEEISQIAYLGWDEDGYNQIYQVGLGEEPEQITDEDAGVIDFAVSPNGKSIVYSTPLVDDSSALWLIDINGRNAQLLLSCPGTECNLPVWSIDGRRIVYERRSFEDSVGSISSYLWWLDVKSGETKPILDDNKARGAAARFSPDGEWLSYVSPEEEGAVLINLADGRTHIVADEIGVPVTWNPTSTQVIVPNLDLVIIHGDEGEDHLQHTHDYETATHLFRVDVESGAAENISGDLKVEDSVPAWSPDGEWIAFGRRFPGTGAVRQLWLMKSDGSEQRSLADEPQINYGPPSWSVDGRYLLFQRFAMVDTDGEPGIWLYDLNTDQFKEIVSGGMQPSWMENFADD
jgi:TolB protein